MPQERISSQLGPWVEGVAYNQAAEDIEEAGITAMSNMELATSGEVKKRLGTASYNSEDPIGGNPTVTFCGEFTIPPTTTEVVMIAGVKAYRHDGSDEDGWDDSVTDGTITANDDYTFVGAVDEGNGVLLLTNGYNPPLSKTTTGDFAVADVDSRFTRADTVAFYNGRAWWGSTGTDYDRLWHSEIGTITTIGANDYLQLGTPVIALVPMKESLAVHTESGIHTVTPTGNTKVPFQQEQSTNIGCVSKRGVAVLPGGVQQFIRRDGIYSWDGGDVVERISNALDGDYWPNLNTVTGTADRMRHSFALYYPLKDQTWFWLPYGTGQTEMNHIMIWSGTHEAFFGPYEGGSLFTRNCAGLIAGSPHAGTHDSSGSIGGTVQDHQPAATYNDDDNTSDGTAIKAYFKTGSPAPEGSATMVRWLYARTYYDATGKFTVTVEQESSGVDGTVKTFSTDGGGFTLDDSKLDAETLGTIRMLSADTDLSGYDPHSSLKFSNNDLDAYFTIRRTHPVYLDIGHIRKRKAGVG
jgi:hypothetical protein